ncbi:hypothetical protein EDD21DRAFT_19920 [Dissophora ornata]|nr:hypothetical protein EDD21DRAFT_19920 [Dissophora ornata]
MHPPSDSKPDPTVCDPYDDPCSIDSNFPEHIEARSQQTPPGTANYRTTSIHSTTSSDTVTNTEKYQDSNAHYVQPYPLRSQAPSPSPSAPSSPPPPPAIRIHNPHTLPSVQGLQAHSSDDKNWTPSIPPEPMPYTPFHIEQLENEKSAPRVFDTPSPTFRPIQAVAPPYPNAAPLYHTTFAHNSNPAYSSSNSNNIGQVQGPHFNSPISQNRNTPGFSSSNPPPIDLEVQNHGHYQQHTTSGGRSQSENRGGVASSANIQASTSSVRHQRRRSGATGDNRIKQSREDGGSRTRTSDASTTVISRESGDQAGLISSSSNINNQHSGTRDGRSTSGHHVRDSPSRVTEQAPPVEPRKRFSLFRRKLASREKPDKHRVTWKDAHQEPAHSTIPCAASSHRHLRNDMAEQTSYSGVSSNGYNSHRKTGVPGRNGEEPETNLFNFVDIILNVPARPSLREVISKLLKVLAVMIVSYFTLMSLYFAAEYQVDSRLENISILVVDLDHSMIGTQFINFTQQDNTKPEQVNWSVQSSYKNLQSVIDDVDNGNYWGAMVVQPNASLTLNRALSIPLTNYDPTKAFLFIYDGGRDPLAVKPYIVASMYTQFLQFTATFNPAWIAFVLSYADAENSTLTPLINAPQVLGTPIAFEELDLHPPTASIISSATSVAYIWIFVIAGGSTYLVAHAVQPLTRFASVQRTMAVLLLPLLVFLSSLSMVYSVVLRIFGVPIASSGQFLSLFLGMLLVQAAVASLILFLIFLIPVVFIPLITTTFVVMNVIAVFHPVELMPPFYRWVYAMPFLNAVQMARYVLMGSYNRLTYNVPILFAWIAVPLTLLPFAIARQKRLMMEIMAIEEQERRQYHQRSCSEKGTGYRRYEEDKKGGDDTYSYNGDYAIKRGRRSQEVERHGSVGSKYRHRGRSQNEDSSEDGQDYRSFEDDSENDTESESRHRHRGDNDDSGGESQYHRATASAVRMIRPPNLRSISNGAMPSAPPESHVFDTHDHTSRRQPNDQTQSYLAMPKLNRHPYASELVDSQPPDEVK